MKQIMLVEDEIELAELVKDYLEAADYAVTMFHDGQAAYDAFVQRKPSLLLLDLMVPRMDGLTICRKVREQSDIPIIMMTARSEEIDRVLGLNMGIWYQNKPLNLTPTEFRLLELFLDHVGKVYSRAQLLDHINPESYDVADRVIDSHIKNLRRKITELAETGNQHEWIQAVYGVGYRFDYP